MKQVIFICLLSVSMCLSDDTTAHVGNPNVGPPPEKHDVAANADKQPTAPPANSLTPEKVTAAPPANTSNTVPKDNTAAPSTKEVTPAPTTEKPTPAPSSVTPNNSSVTPSTQSTPTSTNGTTTSPPDHKASSTVTPKTIVPTPTVQARGFDGASFVGGIILTLGLLAIGFMGFKYYKNQTERNYHTL